jgi:hypothetical protein
MVTKRVVSSNYLGVGLAIATGLAANLGSSPQAQAQVNPNIQTQLNISSPPITEVMPASNTAGDGLITVYEKTGQPKGCVSKEDAARLMARQNDVSILGKDVQNLTTEDVQNYLQKLTPEARAKFLSTLPIKTQCKYGQASQIKFSFPLNPTYETNILKTGNNSSPGESAGFGGSFLVTTGVNGHPYDLVALSGSESSARYTPNFSPSFDSASSQFIYQMFLHADGYNVDKTYVNNIVPGSPVTPPPTGLTTFETLSFGYQNQTAFAPTFRAEKADFLTPQATLSWQNIGLDDRSAKPCYDASTTPHNAVSVTQPNAQFCYYANLSVTAGESFSDVKTLQNANVSLTGTIGWRPDHTNWNLSLQAMATGKDYEDVVGGRRDLLLQIGPNLTYNTAITIAQQAAMLTFTLPVTYYKNYSTLSTAAWSGLIIMPTLSIAFTYPPS